MQVHTKNISHEPIGYNTKIDTEGIAEARLIFRFYTISDIVFEAILALFMLAVENHWYCYSVYADYQLFKATTSDSRTHR